MIATGGHSAPHSLAVDCIPLSSISVTLSEIYCTYHVTNSTHTAAAGLLPLLVCLPGTVFRALSTIHTEPKLLFGGSKKIFVHTVLVHG